jgi:hypothetical protein
LKTVSPLLSAAALAAALSVAVFATAQESSAPHPQWHPPAPTNLQVLPKTLTGEQVHDIMEKWESELGTECSTCHTADPKNIGPNGKPRLNFADDSKPEKATARAMFRMVEMINIQFVSKVDNSGDPVTCGTCHRGHLGPQPFVAPPEKDHDRPAPPPLPR